MATDKPGTEALAALWAVPDWMSPARVIALSEPVWELVTIPAAGWHQILKPSARRVGLVVIATPADAPTLSLTPYPQSKTFGFLVGTANNPFTATLVGWMSVINGAWYAERPGGTTLQVADIQRP